MLEILFGVGFLVFMSGVVKAKNSFEDATESSNPDFFTYDSLFKKYASQNGVDWKWLKAIAMNESSLGQAASVKRGIASPDDIEGSKSSDGKSWGLMQMTLPTARDYDSMATASKLNNPEYSIRLAAKFLRFLTGKFAIVDSRFEEWVIKSYNQGAGNTEKERQGAISGYAQSYWERYTRNRKIIEDKKS